MRARTLGRSKLDVSELTLGTWGLAGSAYGPVSREAFEGVIVRALELGITTFDVAPLWGDGLAERIVGAFTQGRSTRLITRAGAVREGRAIERRFGAEAIRESCEASLRRLGRERIDVLLLHHPTEDVLAGGEAREAMKALAQEGKIDAWGVSTGTYARARAAIFAGASVIAVPYNVLFSDLLHDLSDDVVTENLGVIATSPLDYGVLSGRLTESARFPSGDHRRNRWTPTALRVRVRQAELLTFLLSKDVRSLACAAVRFVLASKLVSTCAIGPRSIEQLEELATCSVEPPYLPEEHLTRIAQVLAAAGA